MKQVSNAYKLSMKSLLREQSFVEITFSQVDTAAATDGNWVSNGAQSYSEFDTLDYGYDYPGVLCGVGAEPVGAGREYGHRSFFRDDV